MFCWNPWPVAHPSFARQWCGMPEVLNAFCPDLITESAREVAIAERLTDLLTGKLSLPSRLACREYASSRFDWQIIAPQVRDVLLR